MLLNGEEIRSRNLVQNPKNVGWRAASYDVTIGYIIGRDGEKKTSHRLAPQQMSIVVSSEILRLPGNVAGYAMPRTRLSNEGILALSTGIVDPGYEGRVASILINFGRQGFSLDEGHPFLRFTFHETKEPEDFQPPRPVSDAEYYEERRRTALRLPDTFLDLGTVSHAGCAVRATPR